MESQPQNPEFRINSENFHPCMQVNMILTANVFPSSFLFLFLMISQTTANNEAPKTFSTAEKPVKIIYSETSKT